jgi:hypothetical protein
MHNGNLAKPRPADKRIETSRLSEAEFLAQEIAEAKAALSRAVTELKLDAASAGDLRKWTQRYPWAAVGTAAVVGFAAAAAVTPAPGETFFDHLSQQKPKSRPYATNSGVAEDKLAPPKQSAFSEKVIDGMFELAKVFIQSLFVAMARPATPGDQPCDDAQDVRPIRVAK